MNKWLKQNLNIGVLITLISYIVVGVAYAAVLNSDVQTLKRQVEGMPEEIAVLQQKTDNIKEVVDKIDRYLRK